MRTFLLVFFTSVTTMLFAQTDSIELEVEADVSFEEAKENYQEAQQELGKIKNEKLKAENELEKARVALRKAELAKIEAERKANPIQVEPYEVMANPVYEEMSKGVQYGYSVFLPNAETSGLISLFTKNVDNQFKNYMKNYKVDRVRKRRGEMFFDNIIIPEMSSTSIDLYADFVEQKEGVTLYTYFNMGNHFLNFSESSNAVANAENIMDHFARYIRKYNLETKIEEQEKKLKDYYKKIEDNKGNISQSKEDINQLEADIVNYRNDINAIETSIDQTNFQLERTRKQLEMVE